MPTLIVSGHLDHATPPPLGDRVARHLSNSRHLVLRHAAHEVGGLTDAGCLDRLAAAFFRHPDPAALDVGCADAMTPPPFAPQPSH